MEDPILITLERAEKLTFAIVVFTAKIITWLALLILALTIETTLVFKVFHTESVEWHLSQEQDRHRSGSPERYEVVGSSYRLPVCSNHKYARIHFMPRLPTLCREHNAQIALRIRACGRGIS
ncbi:MAG: hypothetical protein ABSE86_10815 [Bryobacteraceae bacterium]|jgi:hypothetical protein